MMYNYFLAGVLLLLPVSFFGVIGWMLYRWPEMTLIALGIGWIFHVTWTMCEFAWEVYQLSKEDDQ